MANTLNVSQALKLPGQIFPFSAQIDVESAEVFGETVCFSQAALTGTLLGAGDTVTVRGELRCEATMSCARCLSPVKVPLCVDVDERFSRRAAETADDEETRPIEESCIDLTDCARELLVLELPMRVLCAEDCKGLCPVCGANRNEVSCTCLEDGEGALAPDAPPGSGRLEPDRSAGEVITPFSALKAMIEGDEEV